MIDHIRSEGFKSLLEGANGRRSKRTVDMATVKKWAKALIRSKKEAARLVGGWVANSYKYRADSIRVLLFRFNSDIYGYVQVVDAKRTGGHGCCDSFLTLADCKRYYPHAHDEWKALVLKLECLADVPARMSTPPELQALETSLELV